MTIPIRFLGRALGAAALALVVAGAAHGADLGVRYTARGFDWSGLYIGAQAGGYYQRDDVGTPNGELLSPIAIHGGSYFAGGYLGYNAQFASLVLGIEGDWSSVLGGRTISDPQPSVTAGIFASGESDVHSLATLSGRFGFAADNWLLYGKAGYAWARMDYTGNVENAARTVLGTQALSANRSGWLVGAGIEYGWSPNWLSRVEYNYIDLGSHGLTYTLAGFNAAVFDTTAHVVKAGLAYRFGN